MAACGDTAGEATATLIRRGGEEWECENAVCKWKREPTIWEWWNILYKNCIISAVLVLRYRLYGDRLDQSTMTVSVLFLWKKSSTAPRYLGEKQFFSNCFWTAKTQLFWTAQTNIWAANFFLLGEGADLAGSRNEACCFIFGKNTCWFHTSSTAAFLFWMILARVLWTCSSFFPETLPSEENPHPNLTTSPSHQGIQYELWASQDL